MRPTPTQTAAAWDLSWALRSGPLTDSPTEFGPVRDRRRRVRRKRVARRPPARAARWWPPASGGGCAGNGSRAGRSPAQLIENARAALQCQSCEVREGLQRWGLRRCLRVPPALCCWPRAAAGGHEQPRSLGPHVQPSQPLGEAPGAPAPDQALVRAIPGQRRGVSIAVSGCSPRWEKSGKNHTVLGPSRELAQGARGWENSRKNPPVLTGACREPAGGKIRGEVPRCPLGGGITSIQQSTTVGGDR